jgi:cytochrome c553
MSRFPLLILTLASPAAFAAEDAEGLFVRRVWPLFEERCLACHGKDEGKIKGGLDMRSLAALLKGGDSERPGLVAGKPEDSPLYLAVTRTHDDWEPMPPKENDQLNAEQRAWIKDWIAAGAPWADEKRRAEVAKVNADRWNAEDGVTVNTIGALSPDWANRRYKPEALWAYQPVRKPDAKSIDELIALRLPKDVPVAPAADARTFIRRATFDLLGLPPKPEEVEAFAKAYAADAEAAVRDLVERLLASPHYGERWARHWLDVVRYADSSGFANDYERGNAWRYRDYVVRSFNDDKPYDHFIKEQIAGDELRPGDPEAIIATGFLRMGPWELTGMEVAKIARQRFLDDVTNSVGETFLAHSLQCARCHDHKFDPVPTRDYYAMQACFATTQLSERAAPFLKQENTGGFDERRDLEVKRKEHEAVLRRLDEKSLKAAEAWFAEKKVDRAAWDKALADVRSAPKQAKGKRRFFTYFEAVRSKLQNQGVPEDQYPPKQLGFTPDDYGQERVARKGLERLQWELDRYEPFAFAVYNGRTPDVKSVYAPLRMPMDRMTAGELEQTAILGGGDPFSPTTPVKPDVLSALSAFNTELGAAIPEEIEGRRSALAQWVADARNPLTTRAVVNRIWLWHFGQAIAGNPNNFGSTGKKPTHPELLDWLAATFVEQGWSFKNMHRLIMTSAAYRRGAEVEKPGAISRDDLEAAYAVFKPRRLSAEEMRDAMLSISGELNPILGGIPNRPEINIEVAMQPRQVMGTFAAAWVPNRLPEQRHRRSLYALKIRGLRDPFLEVFNEPAPDFSCEAREVSTVTPQVFSLFNSQGSYDRALALAQRVVEEGNRDVVGRLFSLAYGRAPSAEEAAACEAHWQRMIERQKGLSFAKSGPPQSVRRDAVEENTGEKFSFDESLPGYAGFVPDLHPADVDARTRALADVCLALLNSNEFLYVY